MEKRNNALIIVSYILVYVIWSSTYLAMRISVETFPTSLFIGIRWFFSGIIVLAIALILSKGRAFSSINKKEFFNAALIGVILLLISNGLMSESEKNISSYVTALTAAIIPVLMIIFDYTLNGVKVKKSIIPAVAFGILGIFILNYEPNTNTVLGLPFFLLLASIVFWAYGSALSHKLELPKNILAGLTIQMITAGLLAFALFLLKDRETPLHLSQNSLIALLYLITFGTIGMIAYNYLLRHEPLWRLSTYTFVNPIGAIFLGVLIGNESVKPNLFISLPLIFIALFLMLYSRKNAKVEIESRN